MTRCCVMCGRRLKGHVSLCCGAPGCTLAPSATESSQSTGQETVSGDDLKPVSDSEQDSQCLKLRLSQDASLQDCYLLAQALSAGGFDVSVIVQATPPSESVPTHSDTPERSTSATKASRGKKSRKSSDAALAFLIGTTASFLLMILLRE